MFTNLKNKIKEEIGSDVSTVVRNTGSIRTLNRHLFQTGLNSSIIGSQISLDKLNDNNIVCLSPPIQVKKENSFDLKLEDGTLLSVKDIKQFENKEDEWRRIMQKKETELVKKIEKKEEFKIKLFEKDKEWKKLIEKHEKEKAKLIEDKLKTETINSSLEIALNVAEEYKKKLCNFQKNTKEIKSFQTQEMAKIKHLLLAKEQDVEDKTERLKIAISEIKNLKTELSRLRRYEDELNNIQDEMESLRYSSQQERVQLTSQLVQTEEEVRHLKDKIFVLEKMVAIEFIDEVIVDDRVADLMRERTLLKRKLEETHLHLSNIKTSWSSKILNLEMQVGRLSRQAGEEGLERRRVEQEKEVLKLKIKDLEAEIEVNSVVIVTKDAKLLRMAENIDEMATELKELRANVDGEIEEFKQQIVSYRNVQ